ncbi:plant transposon protein-domain-containing protein [Endogone sp. FLAS-F59071]|nr:plant transposon protein-domain-containing protein [Endogone sp. FLAS-F59071]|eukprot:RUS22878.1 plant transposon protein-domain-containing protein [Endogone sp. FLAS-F59071]
MEARILESDPLQPTSRACKSCWTEIRVLLSHFCARLPVRVGHCASTLCDTIKLNLVLEAIASYDLHIWHAFFGTPGVCNDINILDHSPLFDHLIQGKAPPLEYDMCYFLADGIYPQWATLIQTISEPQNAKKKHFTKLQKAA